MICHPMEYLNIKGNSELLTVVSQVIELVENMNPIFWAFGKQGHSNAPPCIAWGDFSHDPTGLAS